MRNLRSHLTHLLHLEESPHRTAVAFAVGVAIAFSPTYGLHTVSVLLCAWLFRLNALALLCGSLVNNPWTIVPILGLTFWTGFRLTDQPPVTFEWGELDLPSLYDQILPYVVSFVVGASVLSVVLGVASYPLVYVLIKRYRARGSVSRLADRALPPRHRLGYTAPHESSSARRTPE